ncbi:hypothetical protein CPAV1605_138 [seawater metagenome]|uniref:Uncharacterized protein n=1 Tax=seawater metagenome TaxID=1561972 RepID=A0A5E8CHA0_9ZZZZ
MTILPDDCINIILDYLVQLQHKENFKIIQNDILKIAAIKRFSIANHDPFDMIMDRDEAKLMLSILNKCKCCNEHQLRKPSLNDYDNFFVPEYPTKHICASRKTNCNCSCRHISRHICRLMNDEIVIY